MTAPDGHGAWRPNRRGVDLDALDGVLALRSPTTDRAPAVTGAPEVIVPAAALAATSPEALAALVDDTVADTQDAPETEVVRVAEPWRSPPNIPPSQRPGWVTWGLIGTAVLACLLIVGAEAWLALSGAPKPSPTAHAPPPAKSETAPAGAALRTGADAPVHAPALESTAARLPDTMQWPVTWPFNTTTSPAMPKAALTAVAEALSVCPQIVLTGHTCALGTRPVNLAIGRARAESVRDLLIGAGLPPDRLHVASAADDEPVHGNATSVQRAENRRVTLTCPPPPVSEP